MELKKFETMHNGKKFKIEEDYPEVGVYLYVFEGEKCVKDFLQNSISDCKDFANQEFGVPQNQWHEVTNS